ACGWSEVRGDDRPNDSRPAAWALVLTPKSFRLRVLGGAESYSLMRVWRPLVVALVLATMLALSWRAQALAPSNVLVLYNAYDPNPGDGIDPDGLQIALHYQQMHPGVQLVGLTGLGSQTEISADQYLNTVRPQVMAALSQFPSTDVIVTTKGMPLR